MPNIAFTGKPWLNPSLEFHPVSLVAQFPFTQFKARRLRVGPRRHRLRFPRQPEQNHPVAGGAAQVVGLPIDLLAEIELPRK